MINNLLNNTIRFSFEMATQLKASYQIEIVGNWGNIGDNKWAEWRCRSVVCVTKIH